MNQTSCSIRSANICRFAAMLTLNIAFAFWLPLESSAQNINVATPRHSISDSYFENHGVNFGFSIPGGRGPGSRVVGYGRNGLTPNINFSNGGSFGATPFFGGYSPANDSTLGFGSRNSNGGGFNLGLSFSKGSRRQSLTTAPSLTVQNGFGGSMFNGEVRPFVSSVIPIIGNGERAPIDNGVTRALNSGQLDLRPSTGEVAPYVPPGTYQVNPSTATTGDHSVAAIKAARQKRIESQRRLLEETLETAQQLVEKNELSLAREKFREALQLTDDAQVKRDIKSRIVSTRKK